MFSFFVIFFISLECHKLSFLPWHIQPTRGIGRSASMPTTNSPACFNCHGDLPSPSLFHDSVSLRVDRHAIRGRKKGVASMRSKNKGKRQSTTFLPSFPYFHLARYPREGWLREGKRRKATHQVGFGFSNRLHSSSKPLHVKLIFGP